jgi:hypothetical protein
MRRSWQLALSIGVVCAIAGATDARGQTAPVNASTIPRSVPFSGQALTPKGEAHTGSVLLTFGLYTDQTGGTPMWIEQQQVALDQDGRYSVVLGSQDGLPAEAFNTGAPRWLGVQVDGEKEQPRFMLLSVPYALKAGDADTIGGKPLSEFVLNTRLFETVKSSLKEAGYAPNPTNPDGTVGRIARFDTPSTVADSNIYQDVSNNIGIGTTTPSGPLHVLGSTSYKTFFMQGGHPAGAGFTVFSTAAPGRQYTIAATAAGAAGTPGSLVVYDEVAGQFRMQITPFGNVGFGVDPSTANKVHIVAGAVSRGVYATTTSGGEALHGVCLSTGVPCYGVWGEGNTGGFAGVFGGGRGVSASSSENNYPGVAADGFGTSAYGLDAFSNQYRALHASNTPAGYFTGWVEAGATTSFGLAVTGLTQISGNLSVSGSKSGYVVDAMQNVDGTALEPGDVVVIAGNSAPVIGEIPVVTVRKATSAYDSGVVGVVDQAVYVPDAATKAAYEAEQEASRAARAARNAEDQRARAAGAKPDYSAISAPKITISDMEGVLHATADTSIATGGYLNVVTLGSYKMIKVDASSGAIHAGDLLTTSTNPGYAMKVTDKVAAIGSIIGKALGCLVAGSGTIPVIVMPK